MESISKRMEYLEKNKDNFNICDLKNNPDFLDAIIATTKSATATKSRIKKDALLNALENIAIKKTEGEIIDWLFLKYIDELNETQIQMVDILEKPFKQTTDPLNSSPSKKYNTLLLEKLGISLETLNLLINDLFTKGLICRNSERMNQNPQIFQEDASLLTETGKKFLAFIRRPS
ncbi:MAG TPA: hypothetical protein VNC84_00115 [Gammaproteobacteria bacterium]|nr:hypothetical protein [Gammaproteobacteria bacterium]